MFLLGRCVQRLAFLLATAIDGNACCARALSRGWDGAPRRARRL